jgi:hypothetical protein
MLNVPSHYVAECNHSTLGNRLVANGLEYHEFGQNDEGRSSVEQHILDSYQSKFSANLAHFMPTLVSANLPGQASHLSFGLSGADEHTLFLENYLSKSIERELSRVANAQIERSSIVEIGNLAFSSTATIRDDLTSIAFYCYEQGYRYVVCTATRMLRLIFLKAGIKPLYLGEANADDVPRDGTHWGAYYETSPKLIGGNVLMGIQHLLDAKTAR